MAARTDCAQAQRLRLPLWHTCCRIALACGRTRVHGVTMTGAIVWFTGLPSSGKSRLARRVQARLALERRPCCLLDGDRVRSLLHPQPGYSSAERDDFYLTLGGLALELAQQGLVVLV